MTREEAADQIRMLCRQNILPGDYDAQRTADALYMAIGELEKEEPILPDAPLIDRAEFINKLSNAKDVINTICAVEHSDDGFEHPIVKIIDAMINLIVHQEEVRI